MIDYRMTQCMYFRGNPGDAKSEEGPKRENYCAPKYCCDWWGQETVLSEEIYSIAHEEQLSGKSQVSERK